MSRIEIISSIKDIYMLQLWYQAPEYCGTLLFRSVYFGSLPKVWNCPVALILLANSQFQGAAEEAYVTEMQIFILNKWHWEQKSHSKIHLRFFHWVPSFGINLSVAFRQVYEDHSDIIDCNWKEPLSTGQWRLWSWVFGLRVQWEFLALCCGLVCLGKQPDLICPS